MPEVGDNADLCAVTLSFGGERLVIPCTSKNGVVTGLGKSTEKGVSVNFNPKTGVLVVANAKNWTIQGILGAYGTTLQVAGYRTATGATAPVGVEVGTWDLPDENFPWTDEAFELKVGQTVGEEIQPAVIAPDGSLVALALSGLPSGLKFDKDFGTISGAATKAGTYVVKVTYTYIARKVTRTTTMVVK